MKKLFLRITSVALVLLLLFAVGGCKKAGPIDPVGAKPTVATTTSKVIRVVPEDNTVCMSTDENFFYIDYPNGTRETYSFDSVSQIVYGCVPTSYSSTFVTIRGEKKNLFWETFFQNPAIFSRLPTEEQGIFLNVEYEQGTKLKFKVSSNGALIFMDENGDYYISAPDIFDQSKLMEIYRQN